MGETSAIPDVLAEVGPRLRRLRERRGVTLTALAAQTGISKSTLSRLESGQRRASLELLLPLSKAYHLPLDELVGAPRVGDPRVRLRPRTRNGDRKSTRLNSSHANISYAVFCLKKKNNFFVDSHHSFLIICVSTFELCSSLW